MRSQKIRNRAPRPFKGPEHDNRWQGTPKGGVKPPSARALALVTRQKPEAESPSIPGTPDAPPPP